MGGEGEKGRRGEGGRVIGVNLRLYSPINLGESLVLIPLNPP